ncbi:MAG: hypothetical protein Kow00107_07230 [Planctomycetota bacterium]
MKSDKALTREQARMLDSLAQEKYSIPSIILMENAGAGSAGVVLELLKGFQSPHSVVVVAGKGNNGGDGFVTARHLHNKGVFVTVLGLQVKEVLEEPSIPVSPLAAIGLNKKLLVAEKHGLEAPTPRLSDRGTNLKILKKMGIKHLEIGTDIPVEALANFFKETDVIVDALLGTGTTGQLREPYLSIIRQINASGKPVVSLDNPSGLDVNTGKVLGECVKAHRTATFAAEKIGFGAMGAREYCGEVVVIDISMPRELLQGIESER